VVQASSLPTAQVQFLMGRMIHDPAPVSWTSLSNIIFASMEIGVLFDDAYAWLIF
jgi:hypothetical protein